MHRTFVDGLGTRWKVSMEPAGDPQDEVDEAVDLRFRAEGADRDELEIRAVGPVEEHFDALDTEDLELAAEAAGNEMGFLFLHPSGDELWWVRTDDPEGRGTGSDVIFSTGTEEHLVTERHATDPERLSEERLLEMLDEARGAVRP